MAASATFRVVAALDHPHGGRILRLRLVGGEAPPLKELKNCTLFGRGPDGQEATVQVDGFALFGGRPSDRRLARTGRVDVRVPSTNGNGAGSTSADLIDRGWELEGPAR
ncbi:MAG: hypothetical protein OEO23_04835 [Gemmatimonadota bacterium]|nr:hypothetical protein [Gemmatimonadota bacterium]